MIDFLNETITINYIMPRGAFLLILFGWTLLFFGVGMLIGQNR